MLGSLTGTTPRGGPQAESDGPFTASIGITSLRAIAGGAECSRHGDSPAAVMDRAAVR